MRLPSSKPSGVKPRPYECWKLDRLPHPSLTRRYLLGGLILLVLLVAEEEVWEVELLAEEDWEVELFELLYGRMLVL